MDGTDARRRVRAALVDTGRRMCKIDLFTQAAALGYYTAFSLAPLLLLAIYVLSRVDLSLQVSLIAQVRSLFGDQASRALETIVASTSQMRTPYDFGSRAGWAGAMALVVSASGIFAQLQTALNTIFGPTPRLAGTDTWFSQIKSYVIRRALSFGMALAFVCVSIVSLLVSSALSLMVFSGFAVGKAFDSLSSLAVFTLLFYAIFKWMPDRKVTSSASLIGGSITALLFDFGKTLIGLYLGRTAVGSAYGAAGSLIVLLVWVYYSSLIVFTGAALTAALSSAEEKAQG